MNNINPCAWLSSTAHFNHVQLYSFNDIIPVIAELGYILPFQYYSNFVGLESITLVRHETGETTDITDLLYASGLELVTGFDTQNVRGADQCIYYPSTIQLPLETMHEGLHYMIMRTADGVLYSEFFTWVATVSHLVKLEWSHLEDFCFKDRNVKKFEFGRIYYGQPFKFYCYFASVISQPSYPYEETVKVENGRKKFITQISYKQRRFNAIGTQSFFDAISKVRLHDVVNIYYQGKTFEVEEFLMSDPDWKRGGWFGNVEIEFRTDIIVISGRNVSDLDRENTAVTEGQCLPFEFAAVAELQVNSTNYQNFTYQDRNGITLPLNVNDYVLINGTPQDVDAGLKLYVYNGSYQLIDAASYTVVYVRATDRYYFEFLNKYTQSELLTLNVSNGTATITGAIFRNTIGEIWGRNDTESKKLKLATFDQLVAGVSFDVETYTHFQIRVTTSKCGIIGASEWLGDCGVGIDIVESTLIVYEEPSTTENGDILGG